MPSPYQQQVNSLPGAMGPLNGAYWKPTMTTTGDPWSMGAQPLEYNTALGKYVTAYSAPASQGSMSFNFGGWNKYGVVRLGKKKKKSKKKYSRKKRYKPKTTFRYPKYRRSRRRKTKWKPPRSIKLRKKQMSKCGSKCYLKPNKKNPKFPVCTGNCKISRDGLIAAKKRAKQWGYKSVERKASQLLRKYYK